MNYIIDGHNLISNIPGLDLSQLDDELRLVEMLISYCRNGKDRVEVYFDQATVGQAGVKNHGRVKAYFIHARRTADDAIRDRIKSLGKAAPNWTVVTSDRAVQAAASETHTRLLGSPEFANLLLTSLQPRPDSSDIHADAPLSDAEVKEWEAIFKQGRKPGQIHN